MNDVEKVEFIYRHVDREERKVGSTNQDESKNENDDPRFKKRRF